MIKKALVGFNLACILLCSCADEMDTDEHYEQIGIIKQGLNSDLSSVKVWIDERMFPNINDEVLNLVEEANQLSAPRAPEHMVFHFGFDENREVIYSGEYEIEKADIITDHSILNSKFKEHLNYNSKLNPLDRIDETLIKRYKEYAESGIDDTIEVLISFVKSINVPKYPIYKEELDKHSKENNTIREKSNRLTEIIGELRFQDLNRRALTISKQTGIEFNHNTLRNDTLLGNFWRTTIRVSDIPTLLERGDISYIEIADNTAPDPTITDYIKDGRDSIKTDQFWNLTKTFNWIGLLDSGVTTNHSVLTPSVIFTRKDCVNAVDNNCSIDANGGTSLLDPSDGNPANHGSSTASILAGNNSLGNNNRGVTNLVVDSFKMSHNNSANYYAAIRAFKAATTEGDKVVLAEMQLNAAMNSTLASAADDAFDAGIAVIAVAGNYGANGAGSVRCPGNAHKVITVGAYDVITRAMESYSGQGPTTDGRIKPDFSVPTKTRAAKPVNGYSSMLPFGGTSGAGPYGAAAAGIVRSIMYQSNGTYYEPGAVYSYLMTSLDRSIFSNIIGSGYLEFDEKANTHVWWGVRTVPSNSSVSIPIYVSSVMSSITHVYASIWWPEEVQQAHNQLSMYMCRPSDNACSGNAWNNTVWQHLGWHTTDNGTWRLNIHNYGNTSQEFYYTFRATYK